MKTWRRRKEKLKERRWKKLGEELLKKPRCNINDPEVVDSMLKWWGEHVVPKIKAIERAKIRHLERFLRRGWPQ